MPRSRTGARSRVGLAVLLAALAAPVLALGSQQVSVATQLPAARAERDAVVQTLKIGESVRGRPILAHRLG